MTLGSKPLIGITLDSQKPGEYAVVPWYALRQNYADVISQLGATPIALPHDPDSVHIYSTLLDGLIITGGGFDIDPSLYGESSVHDTVTLNMSRTQFEWDLCKAMLDLDKPILGICGGQQLLNVVLGGTLIQDIPTQCPDAMPHKLPPPFDAPHHTIFIPENTLLRGLTHRDTADVNSVHHQSVKDLGPNVIVNAIAPDGIIEGIESTAHRFALGVQWHPEYQVDALDTHIYEGFIDACKYKAVEPYATSLPSL